MGFSKEDILRRGFIYVKVVVSGLRQNHKLTVVRERSVHGWIVYLEGRYAIPKAEMVRLANELQLPVRSKGVEVFPEGRMPQDFAIPFTDEEKARFAQEQAASEEKDEDSEKEAGDETPRETE